MRKPDSIKIGDVTLQKIIDNHQHWLKKDCDGWENMRAYLYDEDLIYADLYNVDLRYAYIDGANLYGADLNNANLCGAFLCNSNFSDACLYKAILFQADLSDSYFKGTDLNRANLCGASLRNSNLREATMINARLCKADLRNAYLACTNLYGADLRGADLRGTHMDAINLSCAILNGAKGELINYRRGKILTESIVGYKKCRDNVIVTLEIPRGAIVFSINGNKCRTNKAKVINIDRADRAYSNFNNMSYYVGDEFTIYDFDCEYNRECRNGIHFFMTKTEAENFHI